MRPSNLQAAPMPLSQYILNAKEQQLNELRVRSKWMVRIRWYYITLLTITATAATWVVTRDTMLVLSYGALGLIGLALNALLRLALIYKSASLRYYTVHAFVQIIIDTFLASWALYLLGGLSARATILYALPILSAGILLLGLYAYFAAAASTIGYAAMLLIYQASHPGAYARSDVVIPVVFYCCVFIMLARITAYFSAINATAERQNSYSQLLAMLRHQLRHPSSAIAAVVDTIESDEGYHLLPEQTREHLLHIKQENRSMNAMISNLLVAASPSTPPKRADWPLVDVADLLHETARTCATGAKRPGDLRLRLSGRKPMVHAQGDQLRMALHNIIDNAFSYSRAGTPVTVSLHTGDNPPESLRIVVSDKGQGITHARRRQLFQRFTHFEDNHSPLAIEANLYTSGLGLYVSKLIVERHGGHLKLTSKPGQGTKVTILFDWKPQA
jgi:signal transduction histidine kinase